MKTYTHAAALAELRNNGFSRIDTNGMYFEKGDLRASVSFMNINSYVINYWAV